MGVKTYKREVASGMLAVFYSFCVVAAAGHGQALEVVRVISVPTFLAVAGAFGFDALVKQWRQP